MEWWRWRRRSRPCASAALLCCAFSLCALITIITNRAHSVSLDHSSPRTDHSYTYQAVAAGGRRLLPARLGGPAEGEEEWGPGSYPPRCTAKCGRCTPCNPVHLPVQPGAPPMIAEYYPEAWRCKCGRWLKPVEVVACGCSQVRVGKGYHMLRCLVKGMTKYAVRCEFVGMDPQGLAPFKSPSAPLGGLIPSLLPSLLLLVLLYSCI